MSYRVSTRGTHGCVEALRPCLSLLAEQRVRGASEIDFSLDLHLFDDYERSVIAGPLAWVALAETDAGDARDDLLLIVSHLITSSHGPVRLLHAVIESIRSHDPAHAEEVVIAEILDDLPDSGYVERWPPDGGGLAVDRVLDLARGLTSASADERGHWAEVAIRWSSEFDGYQAYVVAGLLGWAVAIEPDTAGVRPGLLRSLAALGEVHDLPLRALDDALAAGGTEEPVTALRALRERPPPDGPAGRATTPYWHTIMALHPGSLVGYLPGAVLAVGDRERALLPVDLSSPWALIPLLEHPYAEVARQWEWAPGPLPVDALLRLALTGGHDRWARRALGWVRSVPPSPGIAAAVHDLTAARWASRRTRWRARLLDRPREVPR